MFKKNLTMHPELCFQEDYTTLMLLYCIHQKTKNETTLSDLEGYEKCFSLNIWCLSVQ